MTIAARPSLRRRAEIGRPLFAAASAILAVMLCPASVLSPNKIQRYRIARASGAHDANSASVHLTEKKMGTAANEPQALPARIWPGSRNVPLLAVSLLEVSGILQNKYAVCFSEQSFQTMKLKRAIAAIVLVSAVAAPLAAGTFEDAVDAHARGDYAKALRLIRPLANDGNATAQFNLGVMYLTGRGVQQDYSAAALWFRKAAEQGYARAQSNLGTLYRDGQGVAQNDTEAALWFRKAADQGDAVAEFLLGNQYAFGKGVPQDYSEAMIWFRRAAEQGHPRAMHDLGVIYAKGLGVPPDYVRAHMWFNLSAAKGERIAVKTLERAERQMTPAQINEARRLARDWKPATQPPPR